ncbi:MAG: arginine--tRNA ligase [Clostridiales bacterium]|nr:arginine--tRNA ligase [Clostridiales bacterium]
MSLLVQQTKNDIHTAILDAAGRAVANGDFPQVPLGGFNIEVPADRTNGDFSSNAAMAWARDLKKPPRFIAEKLIENMDLSETFFERCETAGPGFMNFYLGAKFYAAILKDIKDKGENYGRSDYGKGRKINVEFISANPTGPMHMGNARGGALGDCLASVLDFAGFDVSREFYVNDAGNQIEKFALSLDIRYKQLFLGEDAVPLPEDSYHGEDIKEHAENFAKEFGDKYMSVSEEERRKALVDYALPKNIEVMRGNVKKYRIEYDRWFFESELHNDGEVAETIKLMTEKGLTYEKEGALWYRATEHGGEKDEVLVRSNGNPTYFAADIAYHRNKLLVRGFDKAIDIWGADHHGHVARMKGALDAIGLDGTNRLDVVLMQLVRLTRNGEVVRMSKRTGKAITLTDLLEEIPTDAVRFLFNMKEASSQMEFDLDLALEQSAQNPVYYCQYAHARICSIFKKLAEEGIVPRDCSEEELMLLVEPEEKELIRYLSTLTDEIILSAKNYDPARITRFTVELAALFHKFYNSHRVNCGDEKLTQARLFLCARVRDTIKNILTMLKITVPESM